MGHIQLDHNDHKPTSIKYPLCFLAHDMDVPMNVGSLFRIADALGVEKIYLTGKSITPPNNKINKTSRSTERIVDYSYENNPIQVIDQLKTEGYKVITLEMTTSSIELSRVDILPNDKICLVLGSESDGVHQDLLDMSDISVHIPMLGINSSMNVAHACSIATYEITKRLAK